MEILEAIAEGMPTHSAAAIAHLLSDANLPSVAGRRAWRHISSRGHARIPL